MYLGEEDKALEWFVRGANYDFLCGKRYNSSLYNISKILERRRDYRNALRFVMLANEETLGTSTISRMKNINPLLSRLSDAVIKSEKREKLFIVVIATLLLVLLSAAVFAVTRVSAMSRKIGRLNRMLKSQNRSLEEANSIREHYLKTYMIHCVKYIKGVDERNSYLKDMMKDAGPDAVAAELRKPKSSDAQLKAFYKEFDKTFLEIYPDFLDRINACTAQDRQWTLNRYGGLPMELRVLAVMRVGVTEPREIAAFLNFPQDSFYAYKHNIKARTDIGNASLQEFALSLVI